MCNLNKPEGHFIQYKKLYICSFMGYFFSHVNKKEFSIMYRFICQFHAKIDTLKNEDGMKLTL